jgi:YL1 nuclear protein C-terminal domain
MFNSDFENILSLVYSNIKLKMSTTAQRKAWNEAMRSAAGASALPPDLQPRNQKRRSDRRKKQDRREKARKVQNIGDGEGKEILAAAWMDVLEGVNPSGAAADDDDSYDELDEIDNDKKKKSRRGASKKTNLGVLPKRFKARSVASILLEEVSREDGIAKEWLQAEARGRQEQVPSRKFCPVTGMEGIYTEPKTGIPFANLQALEQIQERPPPWMTLGGTLAYHEAVKSIRDEE